MWVDNICAIYRDYVAVYYMTESSYTNGDTKMVVFSRSTNFFLGQQVMWIFLGKSDALMIEFV